jgi:hypothetical protein
MRTYMEKDFDSSMNMGDVNGFINEIRERNEKLYDEEAVNCEEAECQIYFGRITETIEKSQENPAAGRASSQLKLAESSLYWAGQYKVEKDYVRAAEQISFARIQLKSAEEELGWGSRWQGNT